MFPTCHFLNPFSSKIVTEQQKNEVNVTTTTTMMMMKKTKKTDVSIHILNSGDVRSNKDCRTECVLLCLSLFLLLRFFLILVTFPLRNCVLCIQTSWLVFEPVTVALSLCSTCWPKPMLFRDSFVVFLPLSF